MRDNNASDRWKKYPDTHKNLYDLLEASAIRFPDKTAVIDEKGSITYSQLLKKTNCLAHYLKREFCIKKGERIGLLFVNSIEFYIAFYALMKLGAIAVLVNTKMQSGEIEYVLSDTDTKYLIMNQRWIDKVKEIIPQLGIKKIITENQTGEKIPGVYLTSMDYILQKECGENPDEFSSVREDELTAVILHTSGTTGRPKGIMVTHKNIMGTSYGYQDVLGLDEHDISVLSVPVFHILGLSCVSTMFLYMGATLVVFDKFDSNRVLQAIETYHATHFHSVPAVYIKMIQEAAAKYDLTSLKIAVCGGAVISREYRDKFCEMAPNASFRIAYGLTETAGSGVLSYEHGKPGREVPNCHISVADIKTGIISDFGEGEAVCEGPVVTTKVWGGKSSESRKLFTGDIIRKDKNGDIYFLDRIKDVVNRGGEKIFPSSIESVLLKYPGIEQAVVFAVGDELYGEVPAAVLVEKAGEKICLEHIQEDLSKHIGKFELPQYMEIWKADTLPLTANGKIKKKKLREIFEKKFLKQ
ncbi:MAG: class I adenylate-forming enzyme family protein [Eubacteriales bacterium]|nr:class I adenylate-forming enzyme family protein [Eubacteriales bacterium]